MVEHPTNHKESGKPQFLPGYKNLMSANSEYKYAFTQEY